MKKNLFFKEELGYFKTERIKKDAILLIDELPEYFFSVPASSTGKYHPNYALGDGGLVRHTKAAMRIANELLNVNTSITSFNDVEKDLILLSLLIHDGFKHGVKKSKYTVFEHPNIIADKVLQMSDVLSLSKEENAIVRSALMSHMGEWNTNSYSETILKKPTNRFDKFVHMCDFLASRKFIEIDFGGIYE